MDFSTLFPDLRSWVQSLSSVWPAPLIKSEGWPFPVIQTFHLLALATLGGCVLLPSLRLMGAGMTSVPASTIEKAVRPWLIGAVVVIAISGALMALVVPMKLYTRPAFFVKIVALIAALILSFGVVRSIAQREGATTGVAKMLAAAASALWLAAIFIFGTSFGAAPGTFHLICAGWLIAIAFGSKTTRIALGAITAVIVVGVGIVTYGLYHPLDDYDVVMEINRWTLRLSGFLIFGFLLWELARPRTETDARPLTQLIGLITILAWVTVAAAGRWIGLGGSGA